MTVNVLRYNLSYTIYINYIRCEGGIDDIPLCELEAELDQQYCGLIEDANGIFGDCIAALGDEAHDFMSDCVMDICENKGDADMMKQLSCDAYSAFADMCETSGFVVEWRGNADCGK